jgi:hypothetical protein
MKWSTRRHQWQHTGVRAWTEEVQKRHASELSTIYYARTTGSAMILQFPPPRTLQSSTSPPPSYPHASANPNPIQLHKLAKRKQNPHAYSNLTGERHLYPIDPGWFWPESAVACGGSDPFGRRERKLGFRVHTYRGVTLADGDAKRPLALELTDGRFAAGALVGISARFALMAGVTIEATAA